jgi:hypothetical protein
VGIVLHNIGSCLEHLDRVDEAIGAFEEAAQCHESTGDLQRFADTIESLYYVVLRFNVRQHFTERALERLVRVLEIYWATGIDEQFRIVRCLTLCAQFFCGVFGSEAIARANKEPTLQRIGRSGAVASQINRIQLT